MMAECQGGGGGGGDFLIKLFGKTIPVPESGDAAKDLEQSSNSSSTTEAEQDQDGHALEHGHAPAHQDSSDLSPQPEVVDAEDPKSSPAETHQKPRCHGDGDGDAAAAGQREKLKKPDKVLPCPRCNSMDTKFCYFNNYNVNQPRHFCKNCQRYWTAGGAMRNVPVGAGRRKNKNAVAASHFLHRVRAALPTACGFGGGGDTLKTTSGGGTVLSFGSHGAASVPPGPGPACLDLVEQLSHHLAPPARNAGNPGPCSEGSSNRDEYDNKNSNGRSSVNEAAAANGDGSLQHPVTMNNGTTAVWPPYSCAPSPAAVYFSSGIAIPIYPAAAPAGYWGCMVPGAWSLPWPPVQQPPSQSQGQGLSSASPTATSAPSASSSGAADGSHTLGLGKHRRDREGDDDGDGRNGGGNGHGSAKVWAPKTIRIDDVDEVARSSIWSLIGIKGDKKQQQQDAADAAGGQTKQLMGMVFEPKKQREATKKAGAGAMMTSSPLLHANPVALTRSVAFQEGSA